MIQLGGGTRELYYYPKDTMTVINVGENVNKGVLAYRWKLAKAAAD